MNLIVAMDPTGLIGLDGRTPWDYPTYNQKVEQTVGNNVIVVGRVTYEMRIFRASQTFVLTRRLSPGSRLTRGNVCRIGSLDDLMDAIRGRLSHRVWVVGGANVFKEVLQSAHVDSVELTLVPRVCVPIGPAVYFPTEILDRDFQIASEDPDPYDSRLIHRVYQRQA